MELVGSGGNLIAKLKVALTSIPNQPKKNKIGQKPKNFLIAYSVMFNPVVNI